MLCTALLTQPIPCAPGASCLHVCFGRHRRCREQPNQAVGHFVVRDLAGDDLLAGVAALVIVAETAQSGFKRGDILGQLGAGRG